MKKILSLLAVLLLSLNLFSQHSEFGMGLILGNPTAVSVKLWTGEKTALDASFGYHFGKANHLYLNTDLLIHPWSFRQEEDIILIYLGPGAGLGFISDLSLTVRSPLGAALFLNDLPLELFAEIVPTLQLVGANGVQFWPDAYMGIRWYF